MYSRLKVYRSSPYFISFFALIKHGEAAGVGDELMVVVYVHTVYVYGYRVESTSDKKMYVCVCRHGRLNKWKIIEKQ